MHDTIIIHPCMLKKYTHSIMGLCQMAGRTKSSGASTHVMNKSLGDNRKSAKAAAVIIPGIIEAFGKLGVSP